MPYQTVIQSHNKPSKLIGLGSLDACPRSLNSYALNIAQVTHTQVSNNGTVERRNRHVVETGLTLIG